ncbi:mandelate racemase/muconate lactonizing enzyme family protein [Rhodovibrionaceae bacterium A322]
MKLTRVSLWYLPLTSHRPYYMSDGKTCESVETAVIRLDCDNGLSGWGEVCPIPHYLPAYARGVGPALEELAPVLLGADPVGPEALMDSLDAYLPGHPYAKSAIDTALWDLTGQVAGLPLSALLGGQRCAELPLYHSLTCVAPEEMARQAREAHQSGITQFQVKLGADQDWQADVARLRKVREAVGPGPLVYGDWNCGASQLDATRVGRSLADRDIMLEQPCATLEQCAAVRQATGLPMKIDESAHDTASLLKAHSLGCLDAVAIKLSKFGGLSASRRARDLCVYLGARMCIEDTWGSDITTAALLHLGAATAPKALMNVCDLSGYVEPRLAPSGPSRNKGHISPPSLPGLGLQPDPDQLGSPALILD